MPPTLIEWGAAEAMLEGQVALGDRYVLAPFPDGVLVAVVDGLGHGRHAAAAAEIAVSILKLHASESVSALVRACHAALTRTRGAVMTLASFSASDDGMTWLGVGNVEGVLLRAAEANSPCERVLLRGGVVGYQLPPLHASVLPVARGDTLILVTDGIKSAFADHLSPTGASPFASRSDASAWGPAFDVRQAPPQQIADYILRQYNRKTDDALVLVVRYLGGTS